MADATIQATISASLEKSLAHVFTQFEQDDTLAALEQKRTTWLWVFVAIIAIEIVLTVLGLQAHTFDHLKGNNPKNHPFLGWIVVCIIAASGPYLYYREMARKKLLPALVQAVSKNLNWTNAIDISSWEDIESGYVRPSGLIGYYNSRQIGDFITGSVNNIGLSLLGLQLVHQQGKNSSVAFCGSITCVRLAKPPEVRLVLRSHKSVLPFSHDFNGLKEIGIPSADFSRLYKAYGSDQVLARVLLSPAAVENLVTLYNATVHGRIDISLVGNGMGIFVHGGREFVPATLFTSVYKADNFRRVLTQLFSVLALTEVLTQQWKLHTETSTAAT